MCVCGKLILVNFQRSIHRAIRKENKITFFKSVRGEKGEERSITLKFALARNDRNYRSKIRSIEFKSLDGYTNETING